MQQSLNIMKVSLRVLTAVNEKRLPETADVDALRDYLGRPGSPNLDELACDVIQKALFYRAKMRSA
jgi:hypothetical protein